MQKVARMELQKQLQQQLTESRIDAYNLLTAAQEARQRGVTKEAVDVLYRLPAKACLRAVEMYEGLLKGPS